MVSQDRKVKAPSRHHCIERQLESDCDRSDCANWVPPVDGDLTRRRPTCARAINDVARYLQGLTLQDIGWMLGIDTSTVHHHETKALSKLRKRCINEP